MTGQATPSIHRTVTIGVTFGDQSKEIAMALAISIKTVETHRGQLKKTLNIHDQSHRSLAKRAQLACYSAIR